MKRLCLLLAAACISLVSCSEAADDPNDPNAEVGGDEKEYTVKFKVDIKFLNLQQFVVSDNSWYSRLFQKFYNNSIITKRVIPLEYHLTFKKDGQIAGDYEGVWDTTEIVLSSGTYHVTGKCTGDMNTASLSFDENVIIDKETDIVSLTPKFECVLYLFDVNDFTNIWWCNGNIPHEFTYLEKTEDAFYMFRFSELFAMFNIINCDELHEEISEECEKYYGRKLIGHLGVTYKDTSLETKQALKVFGISDNGWVNTITPPFTPASIPFPGTPDPLGRD